MKFNELADYLEKLETTSSRLKMTEILVELFKRASGGEIECVVNLTLGQLAPGHKQIVFNIAEKMMLEAITKAYGKDKSLVVNEYKKLGDLGEVAFSFAETKKLKKLKTKELRVDKVYEKLMQIADYSGEGSVERKIEGIAELLSKMDSRSAKYLARIPVGKLRLGFSDKTIIDTLSWMETGGKSKSKRIEEAYSVYPDVGLLAKNIKSVGIEKAVKQVEPELGVPVLPMLAQRLKSPAEMIEKMKRVFVEPKFDGLRIQIHFKVGKSHPGLVSGSQIQKQVQNDKIRGGFIKAFTRNLNETSWMFPELLNIEKQIKAKEVILDAEAIGVDEERKTLANFQSTMTRRRKHDIESIASKVKIRFYVFDIIYKDGNSLIQLPYTRRREILAETIKGSGVLEVVDYEVTDNPERINELMRMELKEGMEGIIVKRADSEYIAGRTGWRWVKMKEEEGQKAKLADTIDCVVMGYIKGRGKRTKFGIGGFLAGVVDGGVVKTLTKVGTGLTDEQFRELAGRLKSLEVREKPKEYGEVSKTLIPDVWVTPSLVVELAADEITRSPIHSAGYALRFPRLVKFRDDKGWQDATSLKEVKKLFELQSSSFTKYCGMICSSTSSQIEKMSLFKRYYYTLYFAIFSQGILSFSNLS